MLRFINLHDLFSIGLSLHLTAVLWFEQYSVPVAAMTGARSPLDKNRYDTSLGLLTKKFVGLLKTAEEGVSIFAASTAHVVA